jgi:hypothetical protein
MKSYKLLYIHEIKSFTCATYIYTSQICCSQVAFDWVAVLFHFGEFLGLNVSSGPAILTEVFNHYPRSLQTNASIVSESYVIAFLDISSILLFSSHLIIWLYGQYF